MGAWSPHNESYANLETHLLFRQPMQTII